ncbi:MAG TPA: DsbC family protein [Candidatus Binataceae bacterium]|nr:DsbC family protein [Candidatus Binataceae bacterium]
MEHSPSAAIVKSIALHLLRGLRRAPVLLGLALAMQGLLAQAALPDTRAIGARLEARFPGAKIQSVSATPVAGLYEVVVDGHILYTDASARYVLRGELYDAAERRNLTQEHLDRLNRISFSALPFAQAIKIVKGSGARKLAVFEDPDCPYCRKLELESLPKVNDLTVYVFLYPLEVLHQGATEKSIRIWCSKDRAKAWEDAVRKGIVPSAPDTCRNPLAAIKSLAEKYAIQATPTLVFEDGTRVAGAIPADDLERRLAAAK